jgi:hypothetical protein
MGEGAVARRGYAFFTCSREGWQAGLADTGRRWLRIEEPDATAFKGMITHGPTELNTGAVW